MFDNIFTMPLAYDTGLDVKDIRKRKKHRKGVKRKCQPKETVIMTSREVADISGEILMKVLKGHF